MNVMPFFVTGCPKSGTTWLGHLLDAHPEISCKGEACVHAFTNPLERITNEYNDLLVRRAGLFSDSNDFPPVTQEELFSLMRYFIDMRLAAVVDQKKRGLRFVGEKDPAHAEHLPAMNLLYPEAKFIHIIRDGRDVMLSAYHNNLKNNTPGVKEAGLDGFLDEAARQWGLIVKRAIQTSSILGNRYIEVRYEALLADPLPQLKRLLAFLGADAREDILRACVDAASFEKLSKGRAQGQEDSKSFFRKGVANDWQNHMTPAQVQRFEAQAGGMLAQLGYLRSAV
ncbi:MAG TPA: sulfotransferase [Holophagaceae bacterium]|nr:sulfotransferase [Holophagaceae bacterium]